jgi:peptide/nickel transport system substrate-binding protein
MISEYSKFKLKRRWRKVKHHGQQRADDFQRTTHRHFWRRMRNLRSVRRFLIGWSTLWVIMVLGVGLQLAFLHRSYGSLQAIAGGTYTEGMRGTLTNMNPLFALDGVNLAASRLLFNGLLRYDEQGELVGDLAESWSSDSTGRIYTVTLRPGVTWHDGTPLTSEDVIYTFTIAQHPDTRSPLNISWRGIAITATDPQRVTFTLPNAFTPFPHALTTGIVPKHILEPLGPSGQRPTEFNQAPIGTGPFQFEALDSETGKLTLAANDSYFRGRPKLDQFVIRTYQTVDDLLSAYQDGILSAIADVPAYDLPAVENVDRPHRLQEIPTANATYALFNTSRRPLRDMVVRQALIQAVDPNEVLLAQANRQGLVRGPLLSHQLAYGPKRQQLPYDTKAAQKVLDKAGWKRQADGSRRKGKDRLGFTITTQDREDYKRLSQTLQAAWSAIGVQVDVKLLGSDELQASHIQPHNYHVLLYTFHLGADPDVFAYWHSSQAKAGGFNFSEYKNKITDESLEAGRTRLDTRLRAAKYEAFLRQWRTDAPALALTHQYTFYLQDPEVQNFTNTILIASTARYGSVENWTVRSEWR